jgi:formamidopyrimidine-DNA glycosylase
VPELPEVETLRRELERDLVGRRIESAELLTPKILSGVAGWTLDDVVGASFVAARRRAKYLILDLSNGMSLVIHLSLSGQIVYERARGDRTSGGHPVPAYDLPLPHKQTHVILRLDDASVFFLTDIRKFAHLWVVPTPDVGTVVPEERLGVEIESPDFSLAEFTARLKRRASARLKPLLLDQSLVAGLGNIYVDESLWGARLHPEQTAGSLSAGQVAALHESIREVITMALREGVARILNGRAIEGATLPRVHGREGQLCARCGSTIIKTRVVGRGTYLCPVCQVGTTSPPAPLHSGGEG